MSIEESSTSVLKALYELTNSNSNEFKGGILQNSTKLSPEQINEAVMLLEQNGYIETLNYLGTTPFNFGTVTITPRGKFEIERITKEEKNETNQKIINQSINPVGSPFGFTDIDWEIVTEKKSDSSRLIIVFGFQFKSINYNTENLIKNIENMFKKAIDNYNKKNNSIKIILEFIPLSAGYGEHLFNEIARDIISADIAIFDTSDGNSNVMIEMGVALTWGVRVLPIIMKGCKKPPSDISGQTWVEYENDGLNFIDKDHEKKLNNMVERSARKKVKS